MLLFLLVETGKEKIINHLSFVCPSLLGQIWCEEYSCIEAEGQLVETGTIQDGGI